jgi:MFS family permease
MTNKQQWVAKKYILYKFFTNTWFIGAVWLYFYRFFITDYQIGILDGVAFAIGLLAEVPSGALADKFGRGRLIILGQIFIGSGFILQAFGSSFVPFFVGQTIMMIGVSFASGADEALFFEKFAGAVKSHDWRKLVTRGLQATLVATLTATVLGGWLYTINPTIPFILTGLTSFISIAIILSLKDVHPIQGKKSLKQEMKDYVINITEGFGAGILYPKTDTTLLGQERHDDYHISGYGLSAGFGLNITFLKHFFIQADLKGGYINMPDVKISTNAYDSASQDFLFLQNNILIGGKFRI